MTAGVLRRLVRSELSRHPWAWRWSRPLRLALGSAPSGTTRIARVLKSFAHEAADVRFVQVGSCDAGLGDPIIELVLGFGWRGIMVEPSPSAYALLQARYGRNRRLRLDNVAIGERDGPRRFFHLEPLETPPSAYYHQLGSFSREHIEKHEHLMPGLSLHIVETTVPCLRLTALLEKHAMPTVDLLHVDAEGADLEILRSIDYGRCTPGILLFESCHLDETARASCAKLLEEQRYRRLEEGRDCLAVHDSAGRRWPNTVRKFEALLEGR